MADQAYKYYIYIYIYIVFFQYWKVLISPVSLSPPSILFSSFHIYKYTSTIRQYFYSLTSCSSNYSFSTHIRLSCLKICQIYFSFLFCILFISYSLICYTVEFAYLRFAYVRNFCLILTKILYFSCWKICLS